MYVPKQDPRSVSGFCRATVTLNASVLGHLVWYVITRPDYSGRVSRLTLLINQIYRKSASMKSGYLPLGLLVKKRPCL